MNQEQFKKIYTQLISEKRSLLDNNEKQVLRSIVSNVFFTLIKKLYEVYRFVLEQSNKNDSNSTLPAPFRGSSIFHWGFVVGVPSQPAECWGIRADRELAGRYLESPKMQEEGNWRFIYFPKKENSLP